jgi:hypothetical protein
MKNYDKESSCLLPKLVSYSSDSLSDEIETTETISHLFFLQSL